MALPTGTMVRTDQVNVREQLMEKIWRSVPEKTPLSSGMGKEVLSNTKGEYMRDTLAAPNADNASLDGDDATGATLTNVSRLRTEPQIFEKTVVTSGRADAVNTAGYSREHAYQIAKAMIEVRRDCEKMIVSENVADEDDGTNPSKSPGLAVHIFTNALHNGAGATAAHNSGLPTTPVTAGTLRTFTNALLESAMQGIFESTGETDNKMLVCSAYHKKIFAAFSGLAATRETRSASRDQESAIVGGADVYISNFGRLTVVPHYMMTAYDYAFVLDPRYNKLGTLRGLRQNPLGSTGDNTKTQVLMDVGLMVKVENAQAKIADITGA